jgi:hypothetical protein
MTNVQWVISNDNKCPDPRAESAVANALMWGRMSMQMPCTLPRGIFTVGID